MDIMDNFPTNGTALPAAPTLLSPLAGFLGTSEPALRLLLTLLVGYPLGLLHHRFLLGKSADFQHFFFTVVGLSLSYYNYGTDVVHSLICILALYALLKVCGGKAISVGISLLFFMSYLLIGYYCTATKDYDIKWSLLHCVLTLRLIALSFNVYDGAKKPDQLSADQEKTALPQVPSLLEICGYCYFFGGFMVGPQFFMTQYLSFVHQKLPPKAFNGKPSCFSAAFKNLLKGLFVLALYQGGSLILPEKYIMTEAFDGQPLLYKVLIIGLWGKICLYKYVACWLLSEGSCILTGLTYNGEDEEGNVLWNGCNNIDLIGYEKTTTFGGIIKSFNINTNLWVSHYIFKRLKFLGNKLLSQFLALLFLAVWHGLHSGYYICFFNEFIVMKMERDIQGVVSRSPILTKLANDLRIPLTIFLKIYLTCFFGYCIVPFVLLSFERWGKVYASVYFVGHIIFLGWPILNSVASLFRRKKPKLVETKKE